MTYCLYCGEEKEPTEFSTLEHAIPQFLGGSQAPDCYKLRNVCNPCNRNLGFFVDGSMAKSWWVLNWLSAAERDSYRSESETGPPLVCIGMLQLPPMYLTEEETCEVWLGPSGETIFLIRRHDETKYWYSGGNPIDLKSNPGRARAYFFATEASSEKPRMTWMAFRDAFKNTKVKKVLCAVMEGSTLEALGFSQPDEVDVARSAYFRSLLSGSPLRVKVPVNTTYDHRFMCKLALGLGMGLLGKEFEQSEDATNLRTGLWYRGGEAPNVKGMPSFGGDSAARAVLKDHYGVRNAVCICVQAIGGGVSLTLNVGQQFVWVVQIVDSTTKYSAFGGQQFEGRMLVLFPQINQSIELTLPDFLAHKLGIQVNGDLDALQTRALPV